MSSIDQIISNIPGITDGQTEELQDRIDIIRHKLKYVENRSLVACIGGLEPFVAPAGWVAEAVGIAGGIFLNTLNWEDLRLAHPEVMILMFKGLSVEQGMSRMGALLSLPAFSDVKAVKNNRLYIADGTRYTGEPGEGIVDAIELLAEIIQPKFFNFGYEGDGWVKFSL